MAEFTMTASNATGKGKPDPSFSSAGNAGTAIAKYGKENVTDATLGCLLYTSEIRKLRKYVKNAIEAQLNNEGYSLVEVLAPCPTNWGMPIDKALAWMDKEVSAYYTLGELRERKGD